MVTAKGAQWVLGARSETGYVRSANEDRMGFTRTPFGNVYVVSDGMGGYRGGALAAEVTVSTLQNRLSVLAPDPASVPDRVREAFAAANQAVFERRRADDPETCSMGATGVVLVTAGPRALVGHVGDSRAYLVAHRGRALRLLTRDHTRVQKLVDAGALTSIQAAEHPESNVLDRAIGHQPTVEVDVSSWIELKPLDMVLLCSDGLSGYANDSEIERVLRSRGTPQQLADKLVDLALSKGGEDNVTVQLVRFGPGVDAPWWQRFRRAAFVLPATMLATVAVAWKVASSHLDDAATRAADLKRHLDETQRARDDLQAQVKSLDASNAELKRKVEGLLRDAETQRSTTQVTTAPPAPAVAPGRAAGAQRATARSSATRTNPGSKPRPTTASQPVPSVAAPAAVAPAGPAASAADSAAPPAAAAPTSNTAAPPPAPAPQAPAPPPNNDNPI